MTADINNAAPDWRVISTERRVALGLPPNVAKCYTDAYEEGRTYGKKQRSEHDED